jgi:hypothetical protein
MRYIYRGPAEVTPRPNASGNKNVVGLGLTAMVSRSNLAVSSLISPSNPGGECPAWGCGATLPIVETAAPTSPAIISPAMPSVGPGRSILSWPIESPPYEYGFGNTNGVPQVPTGQQPGFSVPNPYPVPTSPAPAPTVGVPASQTATSLTSPGTTISPITGASATGWLPNQSFAVGATVVDVQGHTQQVIVAGTSGPNAPNFNDSGGTTSDGSVVWEDMGLPGASVAGVGTWLTESTVISGVPNWVIAGGAALVLFSMMRGGGKK